MLSNFTFLKSHSYGKVNMPKQWNTLSKYNINNSRAFSTPKTFKVSRMTSLKPTQPFQAPQQRHFSSDSPKISFGPSDPPSEKVMKLAMEVTKLNVVEIVDFTRALAKVLNLPEDTFIKSGTGGLAGTAQTLSGGGISQGPQGPQGAQGTAPAEKKEVKKEEKKEEKAKATVSIKLVKVDDGSKYKVLKEIRTVRPGMNLTDAKALVETTPSIIKDAVPIEEAKKILEKIKAAGGEVALE